MLYYVLIHGSTENWKIRFVWPVYNDVGKLKVELLTSISTVLPVSEIVTEDKVRVVVVYLLLSVGLSNWFNIPGDGTA